VSTPAFELLVLTIERDVPKIEVALPYMRRFLASNRIRFVAPRACIAELDRRGLVGADTLAVDENDVAAGLTVGLVCDLLSARGADPSRAGWYFKQLLIFAYGMRSDSGEHYLVWDADTIPLRTLPFFDDRGRTILDRKTEHYPDYFETLKALVGIDRQVSYSFIAEHMMMARDIVRAFVDEAMRGEPYSGAAFAQRVMDSISDEALARGAGFSEYESYGNFATSRFPERIAVRDSPSTREGMNFYAWPPSAPQLFALGRRYAWASFERWTAKKARFRAQVRLAMTRSLGWLWTAAAATLHPAACVRFAGIGRRRRSSLARERPDRSTAS